MMGRDSGLSKGQRLAEVFRRLARADPATSHDEAYALLCATINEVEDEFTSIPYDPPTPPDDDGRLYPPFADSARPEKGRSDIARYRSRGHYVKIRDNGAIGIYKLDDSQVFAKPGLDGGEI
jgi:hypothetical protein